MKTSVTLTVYDNNTGDELVSSIEMGDAEIPVAKLPSEDQLPVEGVITIERIIEKPERSDIPWMDIELLIRALGGEISEGKGSRVRISLNGVRAVFHRPHPKRLTVKGAVKSVRRFLKEAEVIS